ncbi:MAG: SMP-30/gluconolactonase/LRE family protein [Bryobacteraceae bacterium]
MDVIADYGDLCGECPVWDPGKSALYWTDCVGKRLYCYRPAAGTHEIVKQELEINGYRLNQNGGFVVANNSGFWLWDGADGLTPIADHVGEDKCQMNDCIADPRGRLLAGSWFYDPNGNYPLGKLMSVDTNGSVRILDEGIHLANGLGFSPDYQTLYFTDSAGRKIYAYDYDLETGNATRRRVLVAVPGDQGLPDGMTVDSEGFLWSAQWYGSCVVRYDPDGKLERRIETPAKQTSCVAFGGPELTDLFITSAARSEPMPVMPAGYDPNSGYFGGSLYRIRVDVQGRPESKARISLS